MYIMYTSKFVTVHSVFVTVNITILGPGKMHGILKNYLNKVPPTGKCSSFKVWCEKIAAFLLIEKCF